MAFWIHPLPGKQEKFWEIIWVEVYFYCITKVSWSRQFKIKLEHLWKSQHRVANCSIYRPEKPDFFYWLFTQEFSLICVFNLLLIPFFFCHVMDPSSVKSFQLILYQNEHSIEYMKKVRTLQWTEHGNLKK